MYLALSPVLTDYFIFWVFYCRYLRIGLPLPFISEQMSPRTLDLFQTPQVPEATLRSFDQVQGQRPVPSLVWSLSIGFIDEQWSAPSGEMWGTCLVTHGANSCVVIPPTAAPKVDMCDSFKLISQCYSSKCSRVCTLCSWLYQRYFF